MYSLQVSEMIMCPLPLPVGGGGGVSGALHISEVYGIFFLSFFFEKGYHKLKFLYRGRPRIVLTQQIIFTRSLWIANYNYLLSSSI